MTEPIHPDIPADQAWKQGRRIYIRCAYSSPLNSQLRDLGAKWDSEQRALWVGTGKLDKILPLVTAKAERVAQVNTVKAAGHWVDIPYPAETIREHAKQLGGVFDGTKKQWAMPTPEARQTILAKVEEYHAAQQAERAARRAAEQRVRAEMAEQERATQAQRATTTEQAVIARSGRTLVSEERGTAHGRLHGRIRRPEAEQAKPQPGEIRRLDDGRRVLVLSSTVTFVNQDAIDDGTGWPGSWEDPGWFWRYRYVVVEPTTDERAADDQEAARLADEHEIHQVMEAARRSGEIVDTPTRPEGPSITATSGSVMPTNDGTLTLTGDDVAVWKHPGYYDSYIAVERHITDPDLIARIRAIITAGPRHRGRYEVRA